MDSVQAVFVVICFLSATFSSWSAGVSPFLTDNGSHWFEEKTVKNHAIAGVGRPFVPDKKSPYKVYDAVAQATDPFTLTRPAQDVTLDDAGNYVAKPVKGPDLADSALSKELNTDTYYGISPPTKPQPKKSLDLVQTYDGGQISVTETNWMPQHDSALSTGSRAVSGALTTSGNDVHEYMKFEEQPLQHTATLTNGIIDNANGASDPTPQDHLDGLSTSIEPMLTENAKASIDLAQTTDGGEKPPPIHLHTDGIGQNGDAADHTELQTAQVPENAGHETMTPTNNLAPIHVQLSPSESAALDSRIAGGNAEVVGLEKQQQTISKPVTDTPSSAEPSKTSKSLSRHHQITIDTDTGEIVHEGTVTIVSGEKHPAVPEAALKDIAINFATPPVILHQEMLDESDMMHSLDAKDPHPNDVQKFVSSHRRGKERELDHHPQEDGEASSNYSQDKDLDADEIEKGIEFHENELKAMSENLVKGFGRREEGGRNHNQEGIGNFHDSDLPGHQEEPFNNQPNGEQRPRETEEHDAETTGNPSEEMQNYGHRASDKDDRDEGDSREKSFPESPDNQHHGVKSSHEVADYQEGGNDGEASFDARKEGHDRQWDMDSKAKHHHNDEGINLPEGDYRNKGTEREKRPQHEESSEEEDLNSELTGASTDEKHDHYRSEKHKSPPREDLNHESHHHNDDEFHLRHGDDRNPRLREEDEHSQHAKDHGKHGSWFSREDDSGTWRSRDENEHENGHDSEQESFPQNQHGRASEAEHESESESERAPEPKHEHESESESERERVPESKDDHESESESERAPEPKHEHESESESERAPEAKHEHESESESERLLESKQEHESESESERAPEVKHEHDSENESERYPEPKHKHERESESERVPESKSMREREGDEMQEYEPKRHHEHESEAESELESKGEHESQSEKKTGSERHHRHEHKGPHERENNAARVKEQHGNSRSHHHGNDRHQHRHAYSENQDEEQEEKESGHHRSNEESKNKNEVPDLDQGLHPEPEAPSDASDIEYRSRGPLAESRANAKAPNQIQNPRNYRKAVLKQLKHQTEVIDPPYMQHNDPHGDGMGVGVIDGPDIIVNGPDVVVGGHESAGVSKPVASDQASMDTVGKRESTLNLTSATRMFNSTLERKAIVNLAKDIASDNIVEEIEAALARKRIHPDATASKAERRAHQKPTRKPTHPRTALHSPTSSYITGMIRHHLTTPRHLTHPFRHEATVNKIISGDHAVHFVGDLVNIKQRESNDTAVQDTTARVLVSQVGKPVVGDSASGSASVSTRASPALRPLPVEHQELLASESPGSSNNAEDTQHRQTLTRSSTDQLNALPRLADLPKSVLISTLTSLIEQHHKNINRHKKDEGDSKTEQNEYARQKFPQDMPGETRSPKIENLGVRAERRGMLSEVMSHTAKWIGDRADKGSVRSGKVLPTVNMGYPRATPTMIPRTREARTVSGKRKPSLDTYEQDENADEVGQRRDTDWIELSAKATSKHLPLVNPQPSQVKSSERTEVEKVSRVPVYRKSARSEENAHRNNYVSHPGGDESNFWGTGSLQHLVQFDNESDDQYFQQNATMQSGTVRKSISQPPFRPAIVLAVGNLTDNQADKVQDIGDEIDDNKFKEQIGNNKRSKGTAYKQELTDESTSIVTPRILPARSRISRFPKTTLALPIGTNAPIIDHIQAKSLNPVPKALKKLHGAKKLQRHHPPLGVSTRQREGLHKTFHTFQSKGKISATRNSFKSHMHRVHGPSAVRVHRSPDGHEIHIDEFDDIREEFLRELVNNADKARQRKRVLSLRSVTQPNFRSNKKHLKNIWHLR